MKDGQIEYWATLCESIDVEDAALDESHAFPDPYLYDIEDGMPELKTVGDLKKVLANFNDNDVLYIQAEGDPNMAIKAIWNSEMEYEMTDRDVGDNTCFIQVD